ncbi:MAG TPA: hypothetical protein VGJ84_06550 [Polyangiaceae bacterium]|jgi:general secretion pathway protein M
MANRAAGTYAALKQRYDQLDDRERRLLTIFASIFGAFVVLAVPVGLAAWVGSKRSGNQQLRSAITAIGDNREIIQKARLRHQALLTRYESPAPPLAGYLESAAKKSGIKEKETQDRDAIPAGKKYQERTTKIVLRKVGMLSLVNFMQDVEQSPYPVRFTRLNLRKRGADPDSFDVELLVSAYDRKVVEPEKKGRGTGGSGAKSEEAP